MAEKTAISWADKTYNHIRGCTKVSPACSHCYAADFSKRNPATLGVWGDQGTRVLAAEKYWSEPLKWNREAAEERRFYNEYSQSALRNNPSYSVAQPIRPRVFCASLSDVFEPWTGPIVNHKGERMFWSHSRAPHESKWHWIPESECAGGETPITMDDVRARLFDLIEKTPNLIWVLLTKRPENILKMWPNTHRTDTGTGFGDLFLPMENVWLGTTCENQEYADKRIPELLKCRSLSPVLFLSCEPLLGQIELCYPKSIFPNGPEYCCNGFECGCLGKPTEPPAYLGGAMGGVDWVIAGGESGPHARPSHPDWFRSLRHQCEYAHVPFHFKRWGEWIDGINFGRAGGNFNETSIGTFPEELYETHRWEEDTSHEEDVSVRVGVKKSGRLLDGVLHDAFPEIR